MQYSVLAICLWNPKQQRRSKKSNNVVDSATNLILACSGIRLQCTKCTVWPRNVFPDFCDHDDPSRLSRPKRRRREQNIATHLWFFPDSHDQELPFPDVRDRKTEARLSRPRRIFPDFPDLDRDGATFQTNMETERLLKNFTGLSRPRWRRRDFRDQDGYGATQETARHERQRRDRFGQHDQEVNFQEPRVRGGDGATFQTEAETAQPINISLRPYWKRRDFWCSEWRPHDLPDQCGDGATFRPRRRRRDFPDRGGDGANKKQFFATVVDAARF